MAVTLWVRPHLIRNGELKTFNNFLCIHVHDLGYFNPIFSNYPNTSNTLRQVHLKLTSRWFLHSSKISLDARYEAEGFRLLSMHPCL